MEVGPKTAPAALIVPSEREQKLFSFLLEANDVFKLNSTLRVCGGWVRDKLMGLGSDDIDIALDNMYGKDFAEKVNQHLSQLHFETHHIGVIKQNPQQSKHLETATMKVFDIWVDFVHLRSETYSEDSRIPQVAFGTPQDDASRRDLTINALFYNLNTGQVEDFTQKGLSDLRAGIVRTPLPPLTTFLDDPLRVLRAIRFASRLGFFVEPELIVAAKNAAVRDALRKKISRERIGAELDGMLGIRDPVAAFEWMRQLTVFDIVFECPEEARLHESEFQERALQRLRNLARYMRHAGLVFEPERRRLLLLATAMQPIARLMYTERKAKGKTFTVSSFIVKDRLKGKVKDSQEIDVVLEEHRNFTAMLDKPFSRRDAGLLLRRTGTLWDLSLTLAVASVLDDRPSKEPLSDAEITLVKKYDALKCSCADAGLLGLNPCWDLKPLVSGGDLAALLQIQPGPQFKTLLQREIEFQLENPAATSEQVQEWLKAIHNNTGNGSNNRTQ